jgi:hypothetical protein
MRYKEEERPTSRALLQFFSSHTPYPNFTKVEYLYFFFSKMCCVMWMKGSSSFILSKIGLGPWYTRKRWAPTSGR